MIKSMMSGNLCRCCYWLTAAMMSFVMVNAWNVAPNNNNNNNNDRATIPGGNPVITDHPSFDTISTSSHTSTAATTTRKAFWSEAVAAAMGCSSLGVVFVGLPIDSAVAAAPPKKTPTYLQERGSLESGLSPCPGQPAKKCCWSTEDTQGRRIQRWEAPAEIAGNPIAIANELEAVMAEYPQQGQNDVDRGGWILADKQTDGMGTSSTTYLRYEFTSGKFKYIDELELLVDGTSSSSSGKVSVRTSSRSAGFDYNVNATRLNFIQKALQKKGWKVKLV